MPHKIPVLLNDRLCIVKSTLPQGADEAIREALTIPNLVREKAKKMDEWGWEKLPPALVLYEEDDAAMSMPRGFLEQFITGMEAYNAVLELREGRTWEPIFKAGSRVNLRPWQIGQVETLMAWEQGILKAPAGSGKTVAILAAIQQLGCRSLVIVNTKDILWQWQERAKTFLGEHYPVGQIGDGVFEISPYLTIATVQTIHSRFEELLESGFFQLFSFVCLDECHHATADTYRKVLDRFTARFRVGVSATPDKTGDFALAKNILGPIIHVVRPEDVTSLQKPLVVRVPTQFKFRFRGHKNRYQRSNYGEMIDALIKDPARNELIVQMVVENSGHHQLLVTKRLEHIQILEDLLLEAGFDEQILRLTGQDSSEDRDNVVQWIAQEPGILLSTLADEALDIPRLDRMHLVFPQRNAGLVVQQVGRVERKHEDKIDAIIFDYVDGQIGPFEAQWKTRKVDVYMQRGYKIQVRRKDQV